MDYIKTLRFSGNHLLTLVNDVLDFNKMESGKIEFEKTPFSLNDFLRDIQRTYSYRTKSKNLEFEIIRKGDLPDSVIGDPIRLNQILSNLLSNALKFTQRGSINIIVKEMQRKDHEARIEFTVADSGIGIPAEKHGYIFESFTQASPDTTRQYGGTGLGLAICKKLVELQGGIIKVESEPGKGSAFSFALSFGIQETGESVERSEINESYNGLEGKRILRLKTTRSTSLSPTNSFVRMGSKGNACRKRKDSFDILEKDDFDLILMDLHMPVMDGVEATRVIRNSDDPRIKDIPVVALTAAIMSENHDKIENLSINDYVLKPFKPRDLFDKILKNIR